MCRLAGAWLVRPQDVLGEAERALEVSLDDSAYTIATNHADVREGEGYDLETTDGWRCSVRGVNCAQCNSFVGVKLKTIEQRPAERRPPRHAALDLLSEYLHDSRGVRLSPPDDRWLTASRAAAAAATAAAEAAAAPATPPPAATPPPVPSPAASEPRAASLRSAIGPVGAVAAVGEVTSVEEVMTVVQSDGTASEDEDATDSLEDDSSYDDDSEGSSEEEAAASVMMMSTVEEPLPPLSVEQIFLGVRYLRLVDARRNRPCSELVPMLCRGCERPLSYTDQLLCTRRRWGFGRGPPEPACFVNSLILENVEVRGRYEEMLAQGLMDMSDVYCKCGKQVGYMFRADKTPNRRNLNQVGRMGLVCSAFHVAPYQLSLSQPKVYAPPVVNGA